MAVSGEVGSSRARPGGADRTGRTTFRPDIQGLRAVAVLMVVAAHAGVPGTEGGFAGVDVFFVISGFLITGLLVDEARARGRISLPHFYARRARRILPAGTLVLLVTVAVGLPLLGEVRTEDVVEDSLWSALFAVNWKLGLDGTDYFAAGLPPSPLQHYWSLAVEEQFYLVWPALLAVALVALRRRGREGTRPPSWAAYVAIGAAATFVLSLGWSVVSTGDNATAAYFSTLTRAWELALGALVAPLAPRLATVPAAARSLVAGTGLVAVGASVVVLGPTTPFPGYAALLPVVGSALVVAGGVGGPTDAGAVLALRPLQWVGDRSYSLYLWHWPWLVVGAAYLGVDQPSPAETALLLAGALGCTVLTHRFVEVPFRRGWPQVPNVRFLVLWPLSFVVLLAAAGLVTARSSDEAPRAVAGFEQSAVPDDSAPAAEPYAEVTGAVVRAADAAADGDAIPDGLAPTPGDARTDTWHREGDCGLSEQGETSSAPCTLGDPEGSRTLVVLGDSHAGMWLPTFDRIGERNGLTVHPLVKYSCPAADVVPWRPDLDGAHTECADWRAWAFEQVAEIRPDVVVLSSRTPPYLATEDGDRMDADEAVDAHRAGAEASIERLRAVADRVVLLSETPSAEFDPVTCVDQPGRDLGDCATEPSEESVATNAGLAAAAAETGAEYVDLTDWFCAEGLCPSVVSGMLVYFDPSHITRTYGLALAPYLGRRLELGRVGL